MTITCLMAEVLNYVPVFTRSDRKHATTDVFFSFFFFGVCHDSWF